MTTGHWLLAVVVLVMSLLVSGCERPLFVAPRSAHAPLLSKNPAPATLALRSHALLASVEQEIYHAFKFFCFYLELPVLSRQIIG